MDRTVMAWLAALATLALAAPNAAADEGCNDHPTLVDHYLLKDAGGELKMSRKPPSAANSTTWSILVHTQETKQVEIDFPLPAFTVDEAVDLAGKIKLSSRLEYSGPVVPSFFNYQYPSVRVELVEGERAVVLLDAWYVHGEPELKGSYPGHGPNGAPHTHGDGSDTDRGLYTSDLKVRMTFTVHSSSVLPSGLQHQAWEISVHIDGKSFLRIAKAGEAPQPAAAEPEARAEEQPPKEAPEPENGTANESEPAGEDGRDEDSDDGKAFPLSGAVESIGPVGGVSLSALLAGLGIALLGWRRHRKA